MVVYPVEGRRVRCPVTSRPVPAEGLIVPDGDLFWARCIADGDVQSEADLSPGKPEAPPAPEPRPAAFQEHA